MVRGHFSRQGGGSSPKPKLIFAFRPSPEPQPISSMVYCPKRPFCTTITLPSNSRTTLVSEKHHSPASGPL